MNQLSSPRAGSRERPRFDRGGFLRLLRLVWPQDEPGFRVRLVATVVLLAGAALLNAVVPLLFAAAIDHLSVDRAALAAPLAILSGYVVLQWLARVLNESRWALYGPIDQRLQRRLALRAIEHLHGLSLRFHLGRRTGEISRILDNGLKGLREFLFDAIFLILPFLAEIMFVAAALLWRLDPLFAGILLATLIVYGTVLVIGSEWLRAHQRRAVARAILKRPRIFIFDEATSALDSATEQAVQANLAAISEGTTTVVIAHRLSSIVAADEILVLDRGQIVERGDHASLVRANGLYADLWRRQAEQPDRVMHIERRGRRSLS